MESPLKSFGFIYTVHGRSYATHINADAAPEAVGELKAEELTPPVQVGSELIFALSQEKA